MDLALNNLQKLIRHNIQTSNLFGEQVNVIPTEEGFTQLPYLFHHLYHPQRGKTPTHTHTHNKKGCLGYNVKLYLMAIYLKFIHIQWDHVKKKFLLRNNDAKNVKWTYNERDSLTSTHEITLYGLTCH